MEMQGTMAKFKTLEVAGFEPALKGMRNPLASHNRQDSYYDDKNNFIIGPNDYDLAKRLWKAGTEHRKFLRQIQVWVDISAARYWWSEADTYCIGVSKNSFSTMHKLLQEEFDESDFEYDWTNSDWDLDAAFKDHITILRTLRDRANAAEGGQKEFYHRKLKAMLPESFIQKRTVCLNYETLATMYKQRKNHRLPQWSVDFVSWVKSLPYSEYITGDFND